MLPALLVGLATSLLVWWLWGHLIPRTIVHDEAAYLLQARIFATGACTAPAAPAPEFFEQFHVLVTPFVAAKYPPGHALLLTPAVALGAPVAGPLVLVGLAGILLFLLVRQLAGPLHALLAWALWMLAPISTLHLPSYLSEISTLPLGLGCWAATLQWWRTGRAPWLYVAAACLGWSAITRPLTALVWALPLAVAVLSRTPRRWRHLAVAAVVTTSLVSLFPIWNRCTSGRWLSGPLTMYTTTYMPWDRIGFGLEATPARRTTQPDLERLSDIFRPLHRELTPASYWRTVGARAWFAVVGTYDVGVVILLPLAALGLFYAGALWVGAGTLVLVLAAYGLYAHPRAWLVYYLEVIPVLAALPVFGAALLWRSVPTHPPWRWITRAVGVTAYSAILATIALGVTRLPRVRAASIARQAALRHFDRALAALPPEASIVFVRHAADHDVAYSLVRNDPFFARATTWIAYDRGEQNRHLVQLAPARRAYLYDEATGTLGPLPPVTDAHVAKGAPGP